MSEEILPPHTLRAFDSDISRIRNLIRTSGDLAARQISDAVEALVRRDIESAAEIAANDGQLDALQSAVELDAINTISRRSPQADDLRELFSTIKIVGDLERVGDYAKNIAKRTVALAEAPVAPSEGDIPTIADMVSVMVEDAIRAYIERDADLARDVIERDGVVDEAYSALSRAILQDITETGADQVERIAHGAHLLFVAKNLERVGDHATNIAEITYYSLTGISMGARATAGTV
ncbi:phosphate signaling complex protein PhoU [Novosphingobium sp.]|jgi:phosphate transport system protein|uniref:phosphate signaling complex protein PhoU n=1 Tax=Novosphingobium sp. TaxID=1874826 RepID=UPI0031D48774